MTAAIANARMYAVAPEAEAAWGALIAHVAAEAGVALSYTPYPAPQPLERLWSRDDLGCVLMCGYPIALQLAEVVPLAAPIPAVDWAQGRAVYRSDLIVRADAPYRRLEDSFSGRVGWTVEHSHSGFNALRHHLLRYRSPEHSRVYRETVGHLVTARRVLDAVLAGEIEIGPLDAYWHLLLRRHRPELVAGIRVLDTTDLAPMPAFVASPTLPADAILGLKAAFVTASLHPWFAPLAAQLCLAGFASVGQDDYATTLAWDRDAKAAGYAVPA